MKTKTIYFIISRLIRLRIRIFGKRCTENQNTHFMFNKVFFPKIVPFMRERGKIWYSRTGQR